MSISFARVSIHAPVRGATSRATMHRSRNLFQSTRPYGARPSPELYCSKKTVFQSTRPYGARRCDGRRDFAHAGVSIHAPVRGATAHNLPLLDGQTVSIHAPVRGATGFPRHGRYRLLQFQSTRPYGARRPASNAWHSRERVSIHAPVRGATREIGCRYRFVRRFNPRARTGRDPGMETINRSSQKFQSTRPYGARRAAVGNLVIDSMFQSTRPYGARLGLVVVPAPAFWFQSTRPYGARQWRSASIAISGCVSIHAPVRGATC